MPLVAHRRVHLRIGAEPLVAVGRHQGEMMRRDLHARPVLVRGEERHLLRRRHMQHVHAPLVLLRQPDQPPGGDQRRLRIAPLGMGGRIAGPAQVGARLEPRLVLGVEGGPPREPGNDPIEARLIVDQQVAGGRAHEHLDAGRGLEPFQRRDILDVLARAADVEGEVAEHAAARAPDLVGQRLGRGGERLGVGHLEHGHHAAHDRGAAARLQVLLVLQARLAEVHLGVDHARQHVQPGRIDHLAGGSLRQLPDRGNSPVADADVADADCHRG